LLAYCGDVPGIHLLNLEDKIRLSGSCVVYSWVLKGALGLGVDAPVPPTAEHMAKLEALFEPGMANHLSESSCVLYESLASPPGAASTCAWTA